MLGGAADATPARSPRARTSASADQRTMSTPCRDAPAHAADRARSCSSPASPARASRWRCMRWRTPASSASTTCRPSCCASSSAWSTRASRTAWRSRWTCAAPRSLPQLLPLIDELRGEGVHDPLAVPRRQHRRAGAALLRDAPAASAVGQRRRPATASRVLIDAIELERELLGRAARGVHRHRHQPAAPGRSCAPGCATWCGARGRADAGVRVLRLQARRAARCRLRVRRARAAQPALHPRAAAADRPRRAGGRLPARRSPRRSRCWRRSRPSCAAGCRAFEDDQRSYLTVAIGCTGGQHRSVYFGEQLARRFADRGATLVRHRELDARE